MNGPLLDLIGVVRGRRGREMARRLLDRGASLRLVNRVVMDASHWSFWEEEDVPLVAQAAHLLDLPLPPWEHDERIALLLVYVREGRVAFEHALEVLRGVPPGMVRGALAWWAENDWATFDEARAAVPTALAVMAHRRGMTVEQVLAWQLENHNLLTVLREVMPDTP